MRKYIDGGEDEYEDEAEDNENEDEAETLSPDPKPRPAEGAAIQSTAVRKPGKCGSLLSG